jgi:glucose-1-phosphate thymidylyltransferase
MTNPPVTHRGILLAGGRGTRLHPLTATVSKQLVAVYDKPMIYYSLSTLMLAGIREVLLVSTPEAIDQFRTLLGDGSAWGLRLEYAVQDDPRGIAEALIIGEAFVGDRPVMLALGDNLIYGRFDFLRRAIDEAGDHATVFAYHVNDPTAYGVVEFDRDGNVMSIEEKPAEPRSRWAVPGLYVYPPGVALEAQALEPSARGELEITDLNRRYLERRALRAIRMGRGVAWFDTGTAQELLEASNFIEAIQSRQGLVVGSPEEVAFQKGYIDGARFEALVAALPVCRYRDYLERVLTDAR